MGNILIIEENNHRISMLKKNLVADDHEVTACSPSHLSSQMPCAEDIDIVLINWSCGNGNGWDVFNELKGRYKKMAMVLYMLEDSEDSLRYLRESVQEALGCIQREK